jgi:hypothetical protein
VDDVAACIPRHLGAQPASRGRPRAPFAARFVRHRMEPGRRMCESRRLRQAGHCRDRLPRRICRPVCRRLSCTSGFLARSGHALVALRPFDRSART